MRRLILPHKVTWLNGAFHHIIQREAAEEFDKQLGSINIDHLPLYLVILFQVMNETGSVIYKSFENKESFFKYTQVCMVYHCKVVLITSEANKTFHPLCLGFVLVQGKIK